MKPSLPALGVASLLAAGTSAYGQIIYTNLGSESQSPNTVRNFDIDGNGTVDFSIQYHSLEGNYVRFITETSARPVTMFAAEVQWVARLSGGTSISSGSQYAATTSTSFWYQGNPAGPDWSAASGTQTGYMGFEFHNQSGYTVYGWLQLSINHDINGGAPTFFGYAYQSSPGVAIQAGAIPEPTPAALVMGAAALLAMRQRRRKAA